MESVLEAAVNVQSALGGNEENWVKKWQKIMQGTGKIMCTAGVWTVNGEICGADCSAVFLLTMCI